LTNYWDEPAGQNTIHDAVNSPQLINSHQSEHFKLLYHNNREIKVSHVMRLVSQDDDEYEEPRIFIS